MSFAAPAWLAGLVLLPVLVWAYLAGRAHSTRYAARFPAASTLALAALAEARWRRHLPAALALVAVAALVLALARPHDTVRVPVGHASVVLVLDHSGSMQATDVKPTRLAAAQSAAHAFIDELPSQVRVGVVAFSTVPNAVQAPTSNRHAVLSILDAQTAVGSTATGNALQLALDLLEGTRGAASATGSDPGASAGSATNGSGTAGGTGTGSTDPPPAKRTPSAIVLLSDGAANAGRDPVEVATEAGARKIPIDTVALGNADATIPNPEGYGPPVPVPPDPQLLARIAQASRGQAFTAQDADHLISIYRSLGAQLGTVPRSRDLTVAFALAGGLLLIGAGLLALRRGGRLP